jgi:opacity protein-like surface antigen
LLEPAVNLAPADEPLFSSLFTTSSGPAFGASFGATTPIDGLSLGVDIMHTHSQIVDFSEESLDTLSLMGTVEGAYRLSDRFDLYATGGLGATNIAVTDDADPTLHSEGWAPAYEVAAGIRVKATDNVSVFSELKHQDLFTAAPLPFDGEEEFTLVGTTSLLAGVRFSF